MSWIALVLCALAAPQESPNLKWAGLTFRAVPSAPRSPQNDGPHADNRRSWARPGQPATTLYSIEANAVSARFIDDIDGDGRADLALHSVRPNHTCTWQTPQAGIELRSGVDLRPLFISQHDFYGSFDASPRAGRLVQGPDAVELVADHPRARNWTLDAGEHPLGIFCDASFVRDLDRDGVDDVAVFNPGLVVSDSDREQAPVGSMFVHSGRNGELLWSRAGASRARFRAVVALGDLTGDGIPELAALSDRLVRLDGADGSDLGPIELPALEGEDDRARTIMRLRAAPDLDGDGMPELLFRVGGDPVVLSPRTGEFIELAIPGTIGWAAPAGDLLGHGLDEVVFGVTDFEHWTYGPGDPEEGGRRRWHERSLWAVSAAGTRKLRSLGPDEPVCFARPHEPPVVGLLGAPPRPHAVIADKGFRVLPLLP